MEVRIFVLEECQKQAQQKAEVALATSEKFRHSTLRWIPDGQRLIRSPCLSQLFSKWTNECHQGAGEARKCKEEAGQEDAEGQAMEEKQLLQQEVEGDVTEEEEEITGQSEEQEDAGETAGEEFIVDSIEDHQTLEVEVSEDVVERERDCGGRVCCDG
ncbi:hypothetical protein PAMP_017724 [Pampus punctatissimus]